MADTDKSRQGKKLSKKQSRRYANVAKRRVFDKMDAEHTVYSNVQDPLPKQEQLRTASVEVPTEVKDSLTPATVKITPASGSTAAPSAPKEEEVIPAPVSLENH